MQFRLPDMPEMIASSAGDVMIVVQMSLAVCAIIFAPVVRCTISPTIEGTVWTNVGATPRRLTGKDTVVTATADIALAEPAQKARRMIIQF
jgi:hypothetical protein